MKSKRNLICGLVLIFSQLGCVSMTAQAGVTEHKDVKTISYFEQQVQKYTAGEDGKVLVVYDIDDTLLEATSFFGGDTWYNWQRGKPIRTAEGESITIDDADKMQCLFNKLSVFYAMGNFHLVEKSTAEVFNRLKDKHDTMMLTSRSPDYRAGTEETLALAGIEFENTSLLPRDFALYYKFNDGKSTRDVSYANGIVMSTGLNKGRVLQDILARSNRDYAAIFFIDDSEINIINMKEAWQDADTQVKVFHYTHVPKVISQQNIDLSRNARAAMNQFLEIAFPSRAEQFANDQCRR